MKKLVILIAIIVGLCPTIIAQWVSPGNGITYTFADLVDITEGVVTVGENGYLVNADLTISAGDVLQINDQTARVDIAEVLVTINGSMVCTNTNTRTKFYGLNETNHFSMRFENATGCLLKKMYFSDGAGIKVIESDVTFDDVKFVYFTRDYSNSVINILNCNPTIRNCYFMLNEGSAIGSPVNGMASPQILNCDFDTNVNGINAPQINLGPGAEDTIRIVGNEIYTIMAQWYVGGISIADLMGMESTKVLLKDNIIRDGRYGYNQQGERISSVIVGNQFINNNHEENPMNGGSGISIYGNSTTNKAILRNNLITGNLWGITAIYYHDIDMGTEEEWGYNEIHDNGNGGVIYDLYNNSACDLMAVGNKWNSTDYDEIESHIYHQADDPSLGLVTFYPYVGSEGIDEISAENLSKDNLYYTLEGRCLGAKLPEDYKGVYILNGKKFVK
ncbi:MAG: DUF1565 domain-containing protein [Bacteroidales bacterium]|nr:DUF1565 domain-containing protein [Bacteroidales bacterium]